MNSDRQRDSLIPIWSEEKKYYWIILGHPLYILFGYLRNTQKNILSSFSSLSQTIRSTFDITSFRYHLLRDEQWSSKEFVNLIRREEILLNNFGTLFIYPFRISSKYPKKYSFFFFLSLSNETFNIRCNIFYPSFEMNSDRQRDSLIPIWSEEKKYYWITMARIRHTPREIRARTWIKRACNGKRGEGARWGTPIPWTERVDSKGIERGKGGEEGKGLD